MLFVLVFFSVVLLIGWMDLLVILRRRSDGRHERQNGILIRNRQAVFPATVSVTMFAGAGWILYVSSNGHYDNPEVSRYAAGTLVGIGMAFTLGFMGVFICSRPRFLIAPSMRPRPQMVAAGIDGFHEAANKYDFTPRRDEYVVGRFFANHTQGDRAYGGRLYITNERLLFVPVKASRANGGVSREIMLKQINSSGVASRRWNLGDGSLRRRLKVETFSEQPDYFVVWRPRKLAELLNGLIAGIPSGG